MPHPFTFRFWLPRCVVELRCAWRLDRAGRRLLHMRARIDTMAAHFDSGAFDGPLTLLAPDRDGHLRGMLAGLREELSAMRCNLARWHVRECGGQIGPRLARALARINDIAVTTGAAALALEARLDAHARGAA